MAQSTAARPRTSRKLRSVPAAPLAPPEPKTQGVHQLSSHSPLASAINRAFELKHQIAQLEAELGICRQAIDAFIIPHGYEAVELGDFRVSVVKRSNWTYSSSLALKMNHVRDLQKIEQIKGIATDAPRYHTSLVDKTKTGC